MRPARPATGGLGRERLNGAVAEAVAAGVCGSPWFFVDGEAFFGADRLPQIAWRLQANGRGAMSDYADISFAIDAGVARVTVERPDKLNAYRDQTAEELLDAFRRADDDAAVRALVLTGAGRAFGAGYDLSTVAPDVTPELDRVLELRFNPLIRHMRASRLPIICAVNGPCAGAAVGVALAGDIVIAARSAYFYEPFVGIALVPDAGNTLFLPRLAGRVRAAPAMLLGDRIGAEEARDWGLVWRVVEDAALGAEVDAIARRLVERAPSAVAATKALISAATDAGLEEHLGRERDLQGRAGRSPEMKAEIAAFFAKRSKG